MKGYVTAQGEALVQRILTGMMFTFPRDCLQDASGVLMALFELMPQQAAQWFKSTIGILPGGSIKAAEADRVMNSIAAKVQAGDYRKLRAVLQGIMYLKKVGFRLLTWLQTSPHHTAVET